MNALDELLLLAEERDLWVVIYPSDDGVTAALVGEDVDVVASGEDSGAALEALVRCVRYREAEALL